MPQKLFPQAMTPVLPSEFFPEGWLKDQLRTQADGLSGHLDLFWPDIRDSQWTGGTAEGWERLPYWLDGFIPLAWLLRDEGMMARATHCIEGILQRQKEDGWICPGPDEGRGGYDLWGMFLILKVLVVYHDATGDDRIPGAVKKALKVLNRHIRNHPLKDWAQMRWFECLIPLFWLYDREPETWLVDLAVRLRSQGFDWEAYFEFWPCRLPEAQGVWDHMSHVVNNAMMLKMPALMHRLTGRDAMARSAGHMLKELMDFHGMVTGVFTGDECLSGTSPVQGTELCAVAELMYSFSQLAAITGDTLWADRLEQVGFNALPATFSPDMWTHQYDQQVNQIRCAPQETPVFRTNGGESHLFGLEPNFGCCTANLSQAWPKFALSTWMRSEGNLYALTLLPGTLKTTRMGADITIRTRTDYPFHGQVHFELETSAPVSFTLNIRIPGWTQNAALTCDGERIAVKEGCFAALCRQWHGTHALTLTLPMPVTAHSRPNALSALSRGPLVFALPLAETWVRHPDDRPEHAFPHCDYSVLPQSPWNYALLLRESSLDHLEFETRPLTTTPFSPDAAPVRVRVSGVRVPWQEYRGSAAPAPDGLTPQAGPETLTLIPYGCTNLRMTEMPWIGK